MDPFFWGAGAILCAEIVDDVVEALGYNRWAQRAAWTIVWLGGNIGYFTWIK